LRLAQGFPDCDEFQFCAPLPLQRRKGPLLDECGKPNPTRVEVRRGLEAIDFGFPRLKVRRGGSIRISDSG
jgi:hypothetical protein